MESGITLIKTGSEELLPAAAESSVLYTSQGRWKGIEVEHHILPPDEMPEHLMNGHRLMINIGGPVTFEHKIGASWERHTYRNGDFDLLSTGEMNHPRWHDELNIIAIELDPAYFPGFSVIPWGCLPISSC